MTTNNNNATPEYREFYLVDINERVNRAMTVYHAMACGDFKPLHLVMDLVTGTRYVSANEPGQDEVIIETLSFDEQVEEYWAGYMYDASNRADDEISQYPIYHDSFDKICSAMVEVELELGAYGFNWVKCDDIDQVRELTGAGDIMAIEVTENGCHIFKG